MSNADCALNLIDRRSQWHAEARWAGGEEGEGVAELEILLPGMVPEFVKPLRPNIKKVAHPQSWA